LTLDKYFVGAKTDKLLWFLSVIILFSFYIEKDMNMHKILISTEKFLLCIIAMATLYATMEEVFHLISNRHVELADLLLLFIYTEVLGMVAVFYKSQKIPITLPLFIAMTALSRLIILQGKESEPVNLLYEAVAIVLIAAACLIIRFRPQSQDEDLPLV
jgi:protein PsiE